MFTIFLTEIQPVCLHFGKIEKSINKGKKNSKNNFWASNFYDKLIFNSFGPKNGNIKIPINFLFTYLLVNQQTADLLKKLKCIEWLSSQDPRLDMHSFYVTATVPMLGAWERFVNKKKVFIGKILRLTRTDTTSSFSDLARVKKQNKKLTGIFIFQFLGPKLLKINLS